MPQTVAIAAITVSAVVPILIARVILGVIVMALQRGSAMGRTSLRHEPLVSMSPHTASSTVFPAR